MDGQLPFYRGGCFFIFRLRMHPFTRFMDYYVAYNVICEKHSFFEMGKENKKLVPK